jgi:hypothetical protein
MYGMNNIKFKNFLIISHIIDSIIISNVLSDLSSMKGSC